MIKIKLKVKESAKVAKVADVDVNKPFDSKIKPYVDKVIEVFGKTCVKQDLIIPIECAIRQKTAENIKELHKENDFEVYKNMYMTISRHIIDNLRTDNQINNLDLIEKVNSGTITPERLLSLNPEEMYSERWRKIIEKQLSDIDKLTKDPESTTELFWCGRCHRNKCTYFERQDRSSDEPMTIHITCCFCGKKWRK